jgi:transglutaminase-like putative cysteine protease
MSWLPRFKRKRDGTIIGTRTFDLMCLTMTAVLALHAAHLPWWLVATLAVALALRWWQRRHHAGKAPLYLKLPLVVLLTFAVITSYGTIFGRGPGSALAVGLLVLKLIESETPRDTRVSMSVACFVLMAALLFDQGLSGTVLVALGLLPALAALRSLEPAQTGGSLPRQLMPGLVLLAVSIPLTLLAFLLIPRLSSPLWGAPSQQQAKTGLSDQMSPGGMVDLLTDDTPAMRVSFDGPAPDRSQLYFRAYVMWRYDGRSWQYVNSAGGPKPDAIESSQATSYTVTLQPTQQYSLPALDMPLEAPDGAAMRRDHEVMREKPVNDAITYRLRSALRYRLDAEPGERARRYGLALPPGYNPRTLALGQTWRQRHGSNDTAIVQAALDLFHDGGFSYNLAAPPLGRDAMDDFLFSTHEGFCEHYASAFTVLMRAAGIPARVVTGYQGGYWNKLGHYLLVRNSDAHAWSEVWLAGRGWVRIDPTAAVRPERVSLGAAAAAGDRQLPWYENAWLQNLRNHWDIVNRLWDKGVVGFDALRQRGLLTPFGVRDTDTRTLGLLLAIGTTLFAVAGLGWAMLRRVRIDPVLAGLRRLERALGKQGISRRHNEGPQHFLSRAARGLPQQRSELEGLMNMYLRLRYADSEPPPESLRLFRRAVREFRVRHVVK